MEEFILFIVFFLIVYFIYLFLIILRKKKLEKYRNSTEIRYLVGRYHVDMKASNMKTVANIMALTNAFIISLTVTIISFIPNFIIKILVGFVLLIVLILISYDIIGKYFQKKYGIKKH